MKIFYATFGCGFILGNHILKVVAEDEMQAREILNDSRLLQTCVAFVYDEEQGFGLIAKYGYTVIEGKVMV